MAPPASASAAAIVEDLQQLIVLGNQASSNMHQYLKDNETIGEKLASDLVIVRSRMRHFEKSEDEMAALLGKKAVELERVTQAAKNEAAAATVREVALRQKIVMLESELKDAREKLTTAYGPHPSANTETTSDSTMPGQSSGRLPCTNMQTESGTNIAGQGHEQVNHLTEAFRTRKRPRYRHDPVSRLSTGMLSLNTPFELPPNPTSYPVRLSPRARSVSVLPSYDSKNTSTHCKRPTADDDVETLIDSSIPSIPPTAVSPGRNVQFPINQHVVCLFEPDLKKLFGNLNHNMQQIWTRIALLGEGWSRGDIETLVNLMARFEVGKRLDTKPATVLDKCAARIKANPTMYQRCLWQEFDGPSRPYINLQRTDQDRACQPCIKKRTGPCVYVKFAEDTGRSSHLERLDKEKTPLLDFVGDEQTAPKTPNITRWELIKRDDGVPVPPYEIGLARDAAALMVL